jgi:hypothetical protein
MSRTNPAAGLADARQPFRNKETIMFNRLALALLAATLLSAPVMAQAPAPSGAPAASDTAKPAAKHVHKAEHVKAKKPKGVKLSERQVRSKMNLYCRSTA